MTLLKAKAALEVDFETTFVRSAASGSVRPADQNDARRPSFRSYLRQAATPLPLCLLEKGSETGETQTSPRLTSEAAQTARCLP